MSDIKLTSLALVEAKQAEDAQCASFDGLNRGQERIVFLGFFAIGLISTLMISGALNI